MISWIPRSPFRSPFINLHQMIRKREILAQASLVEVEVSLTEVSEQSATPQDTSEQTSTLADTPDRVSAEPQKEPPVASFLSMSAQRKTNLTVPDPEQLFPNGPGILQCSIKEIVPDAPIDRQVFSWRQSQLHCSHAKGFLSTRTAGTLCGAPVFSTQAGNYLFAGNC